MNKLFRILNLLLLAAILAMLVQIVAVLVQIRQHMPPTIGEFRHANTEVRQALRLRQLYGTISVEIDNTPLPVEVDNTPLDVQIER
jgi:hypothetical protein